MTEPAIRALIGQDTPWPLTELLRRLAEAANHLLNDHDCDTHGWEGIRYAANEAIKRADELEALLAAGEAAETPRPPQTSERLDDIPLDVRRELMNCAVQSGRISFYWLCHLYRRGRDAATTYSPGVPTAETPQLAVGVHRCKICGTRWLLWPDAVHGGGWNLLDSEQRPGGCCDNVAMGDQIEHLRDIPLTLAASLSPVKDDALSTAIAFCMFIQSRADVPEVVKGTASDVEEELRAASLSSAVPTQEYCPDTECGSPYRLVRARGPNGSCSNPWHDAVPSTAEPRPAKPTATPAPAPHPAPSQNATSGAPSAE